MILWQPNLNGRRKQKWRVTVCYDEFYAHTRKNKEEKKMLQYRRYLNNM